jgi:hypothetical protein
VRRPPRGALLLAGLAAGLAGPARAGGAATPGAYCPLPEKGEVPKCMAPAQATYSDYFAALERGQLADADTAQLEQTVAEGAASGHAYLALSSLTYGYYQLARREAGRPEQDPEVALRLARWNTLLERAYAASAEDDEYRRAVRRAARELRERAPIQLPCQDAEGAPAACSSTESVLRGLEAADERAGIRGALERLLRRFIGGSSA